MNSAPTPLPPISMLRCVFFFPRPAPGRLIPNIEMGGTGVGAAGRMVYSLEYDSRYFLPGMVLKRVNVVFEAFRAFRGQLRRPLMFLEFYHTCFRILPHTFRILPHTLQRACPLQRPLDPTRHNPTGRPGGREAGGREAGRPGGWEAGRPCLLLASCITLF